MALVKVTYHWDDKHGPCYDCGNPAAFYNSIKQALCALCAANHAADGDTIDWIEPQD